MATAPLKFIVAMRVADSAKPMSSRQITDSIIGGDRRVMDALRFLYVNGQISRAGEWHHYTFSMTPKQRKAFREWQARLPALDASDILPRRVAKLRALTPVVIAEQMPITEGHAAPPHLSMAGVLERLTLLSRINERTAFNGNALLTSMISELTAMRDAMTAEERSEEKYMTALNRIRREASGPIDLGKPGFSGTMGRIQFPQELAAMVRPPELHG